jgi:Protein of unknown function (DUF4013)
MDIGRAVSYIFDDQEWGAKLLISAMIAFGAVITSPLLVGLIGWAALLGYLVELLRNLHDRHPTPLPRWDNYGEKISQGGSVLTAVILYSLPNLLPLCCTITTSNLWGDGFFGSSIGLLLVCCVLPGLLVYNLITWPMLALGIARYAEERNIGVFFQFNDLFGAVYRNLGLTMQWVLVTLIVNIGLGIVGAIPCVGWAAAPALAIPVHGYLLAQFTGQIESGTPAKRKR